jgi:hypothetical protein
MNTDLDRLSAVIADGIAAGRAMVITTTERLLALPPGTLALVTEG